MSIHCIVLDLDRTTLNSHGKLSKGNRAAIEKSLEKGIEIVIASGRSYLSLPRDITGIKGIRYAVTLNGASIYEITSGKCIYSRLINPSAVDKILSIAEKPVITGKAACEAFVGGDSFCAHDYYDNFEKFGAYGAVAEYLRSTRRKVNDIIKFIRDNKKQISGIDIVTTDMDLKRLICDELKSNVPDVYITSSLNRMTEISDRGSGKHNALKYLLNIIGISSCETAAFGDADNDAEMLSYAAYGVAVDNASEKCRQSADYITLNHDEDGFAYWINSVMPTL